MFDGIHHQEQFHQFLASSSSSISSSSNSSSRAPPSATHATAVSNAALDHLPLNFSLYGYCNINNSPSTYPSSTSFDHQPPPPPLPPAAAHQQHHHLQQQQDQVALHAAAAAAIHQHHHPHLHQHHHLHKDYNHHHHGHHLDEGDQLQVVKEESGLLQMSTGLVTQHLQVAAADDINPWSNEEVLSLLTIRSSVDINWFPDFTWEHVSRKLGERGFNRSADKCKEKFEEENRYLNSISCNSKNYRPFGWLEDLYHSDHHHQDHDHGHNHENQLHQHLYHHQDPAEPSSDHHHDNCNYQNEEIEEDDVGMEDDSRRANLVKEGFQSDDSDEKVVIQPEEEEEESKRSSGLGKRKRHRKKMKFEIFKGFCESIVNKMLAHQEELHSRILENLVKRDDERIVREDAWKMQEMGRINKEMEFRAQEHALAIDRQAKIIELLNKFTSSACFHYHDHSHQTLSQLCLDHLGDKKTAESDIAEAPKPNTPQTPTSSDTIALQANQNNSSLATQSSLNLPTTTSSNDDIQASPNPSSIIPNTLNKNVPNSPHDKSPRHPKGSTNLEESSGDHRDSVKRWPRDEVLALINIRCSHYNTNSMENTHSTEKGGARGGSSSSSTTNSSSRGPLWERISKGMLELGYKRSAKRCKEKWENINKYFRKTKDMNKKRSLDSRTCPYFHHLSYLYSVIAAAAAAPTEGLLTLPEGGQEKDDRPENDQGGSAHASDDQCSEDRNVFFI